MTEKNYWADSEKKGDVVKDRKNEGVNSLMVESRLNIFHSKFNWRIFCDTDSWISCLKIKQILQIIITITSRNNVYIYIYIYNYHIYI